MADFLHTLVFGIYPYICLAVLAIGSILRFEREPYSWRAGSSQLLRRKQLVVGSLLFHVGVLIIFFGHFVGLLTPIWIYELMGFTHSGKQLMAITVGGVAGIIAFIGATMLLHRRLFDPRIRRNTGFGDMAILMMLWLQLILGLGTVFAAFGHMDGEEMIKLMTWSQGIFIFEAGVADIIKDVHPVFKAHLFLGLTIFLVFPFTRLVHMLSVPVRYIWRSGYQIVRTKSAE